MEKEENNKRGGELIMEQKIIMKDPRKSDYFYEESMKPLRTNIQFSSKKVKQIIFTS